jgi:hypothetical protein
VTVGNHLEAVVDVGRSGGVGGNPQSDYTTGVGSEPRDEPIFVGNVPRGQRSGK